jgi:PTH1 family peptidyl-tRNA hydrolase
VILGLGNPGREYEATRHNVGWWVVDHLADVWHFRAGGLTSPVTTARSLAASGFDRWKKDGDGLVASGSVGPIRTRLIKPLTYMNLSGAVLKPYLRRAFWSPATDLLVVVDDVELPFGKLRLRASGSAGGHNGLKSVEHALGTREYPRMRIGIAPSDPHGDRGNLADFVLDRFSKVEEAQMKEQLPIAERAVETWLSEGISATMNKFNA